MRASFFGRAQLKNTSFDDARRAYVEWVVGAKRFDRARVGREAVGIDTRWPMRDLHSGASFFGKFDARVDTRVHEQRFLLRLVHRDSTMPGVLWHSVAELEDFGDSVRISHAVGRGAPPDTLLQPQTGAPKVLRRLLRWNGPNVEPVNIGDASPIEVNADGASSTLDWLILDRKRICPIVLVTPTIDGGAPLVDPKALASRLAGMARLVVCSADSTSKAMAVALQQRGFPRQFATIDGAIRVFLAGLGPADSPYRHRLWTRSHIEASGNNRLDLLAGKIAEFCVRHTIPQGFFHAIETFDLNEARTQVRRIQETVGDPEDKKEIEALRTDRDLLKSALDASSAQLEELTERVAAVEGDHYQDLLRLEASEQALDQLRDTLRREQAKNSALTASLDGKDGKGAVVGPARTDFDSAAVRAVVSKNERPTPNQCLKVLDVLYGDRVIILDSAWESSQRAQNFRYGHILWELLENLATKYRASMINERGGDGVAKEVFGAKFAAKESETTMSSEKARNARTFSHEGVEYVMWRHLKLGVADTTVESIRVHFEWLADQELILIGHCGEHLFLPRY